MICEKSHYFDRACTGSFAEASSQEITLHDDDPAIVACFLQGLYEGEYNDSLKVDEYGYCRSKLEVNVQVYAVAEKYETPGMKTLSLLKIVDNCEYSWTAEDFVAAAFLVWQQTPETDRAIRDVFIQSLREHAQVLTSMDSFNTLVRDGGDFAVEALKALVPTNSGEDFFDYPAVYFCTVCDTLSPSIPCPDPDCPGSDSRVSWEATIAHPR